jgi:quercetin dioxygenase-like cupin family protein
MNRKQSRYAGASLSALLCAASPAAFGEQIKPVFQHELPNEAGKVLSVVEVDLAGGTKAGAHRHGEAFVYAYVLSGTVRSQLAGEPVRTYRAGEGWFEPPGARPLLTENQSRTTPARLLVAFVASAGESLKTPDPAKDTHTMASTPNQTAASSPIAASQSAPPPQQMVDALYKAFGDHHSRAVHAKGTMP